MLYKFACMRPAYLAFIVVACLCYGCEKKKNTAPSTVTTTTHPIDTTKVASIYPYTDTFYGVWYNYGDYEDPIGGNENDDTSFNTVCYVRYVSIDSMYISAGITTCYGGSYIPLYFVGFALNLGLAIDSSNSYDVGGTSIGLDSNANVNFRKDSIFFTRQLSADCSEWINYGTFAGKGNVHKH